MNPRNTRVLVSATALLAASLFPAWSQSPPRPRPVPKKPASHGEVIIKPDTPADQDPTTAAAPADQAQAQTSQDQSQGTQGQTPAPQGTAAPAQPPAATPDQGATANPNAGKGVPPEQIGLSFSAPQGWQQGDPTKLTLPGTICCVWSPDGTTSVAIFVQNSGKPYNPRVLLEQSAEALQKGLNAEVRTKEIVSVGGMRGFSLVVSGPGTGAAIDGKGTVRTNQHWVAIPRDKDVVIFLMTTPDEKFAANEQVFQTMLSSLKVTGTQTPDQQAAK